MSNKTKSVIEIPEEWKIRLYVLNRGYIRVAITPDPMELVFWVPYVCARTIRRWGTTDHGLAKLVEGPTANTVLDVMTPNGKFPVSSIIDVMEVDQKKWKKYLIS